MKIFQNIVLLVVLFALLGLIEPSFGDVISGSFAVSREKLELRINNNSKESIIIKGIWNRVASATLEMDKSGKIDRMVSGILTPDLFYGNRIWLHLQPHDEKFENFGSSAVLKKSFEAGDKTKELLAAPRGSVIRFRCDIWRIENGVIKPGKPQEVVLVKE